MDIRKIAAAAGFACGAALAFAPLASANPSSDWWSSIDGLLAGASPADVTPALNLAISFDGYSLLNDGNAVATTLPGQFGLAIAYGDHATAYAAGGFGDSALASGTYALAEAGSKTVGATGFNFDSATDIGNNAHVIGQGAPDGAYAGGGSLIGNTDAPGVSANDTAQFLGNGGSDMETTNPTFGNSGAFAGDSGLIGYNHVAGSGDTAYTSGNIAGFGDGSAAVGGNSDSAYTTGTETGTNEGAFSGFGNFNSATADTNYTLDNHGVSATFGNGNYAFVNGPNDSTAHAGGVDATATTAAHLGNNNVSVVSDPFGTAADSANAGSSSGATGVAGSNDLAEVLYTHGNASATGGSNLYDVLTPFGPFHSASLPAAADPALVTPPADPLAGTVASEVASANSLFQLEATLAGVPSTDYSVGPQGFDIIGATHIASDAPATAPFSPLDYELFGVNPGLAGVAGDPGAFSEFNGALVNFYDAYNVELWSLANPTAVIGTIPLADLFGSSTGITEALATGTATSAVTDFLTDGYNDLLGYLGVFGM